MYILFSILFSILDLIQSECVLDLIQSNYTCFCSVLWKRKSDLFTEAMKWNYYCLEASAYGFSCDSVKPRVATNYIFYNFLFYFILGTNYWFIGFGNEIIC